VLASTTRLQKLEFGKSKRLREALTDVANGYEAILLECPPSLVNLTKSAPAAALPALMVVEPSALGAYEASAASRTSLMMFATARTRISDWRV
jgi:cellulose biosynthesis protein BcsQ